RRSRTGPAGSWRSYSSAPRRRRGLRVVGGGRGSAGSGRSLEDALRAGAGEGGVDIGRMVDVMSATPHNPRGTPRANIQRALVLCQRLRARAQVGAGLCSDMPPIICLFLLRVILPFIAFHVGAEGVAATSLRPMQGVTFVSISPPRL